MYFGDFFRRERKRRKNWRLKDPMNASERIDQLIAGLTDWRGKTLASVHKTILEADREIIEEWKWMGSPVWSHDGMIAVGNVHKDKVKLTFSHGASLPDPDKRFNAGLGGNMWRAIDFFEDDAEGPLPEQDHTPASRWRKRESYSECPRSAALHR
jgi:hypothetical protein